VWHFCSPRGRSSGILLGNVTGTMDVLACWDGEFHVKLHIFNRADNFTCSLVAVYDAAQNEFKANFFEKWLT
jgi:hypothetical protein